MLCAGVFYIIIFAYYGDVLKKYIQYIIIVDIPWGRMLEGVIWNINIPTQRLSLTVFQGR